jgi:hypothetical protein
MADLQGSPDPEQQPQEQPGQRDHEQLPRQQPPQQPAVQQQQPPQQQQQQPQPLPLQQPAVQQQEQDEGDVMADVAPGAFVTAGGKQSWGMGRPGGSKGEWAAVLLFCCWGCS